MAASQPRATVSQVAALELNLPPLQRTTLVQVLADVALRHVEQAGFADPRAVLGAALDYPLPKPGTLGGGTFKTPVAIRDLRKDATVAIVYAPEETDGPRLADLVEPYKRYAQASPHIFDKIPCRLIVFLPRVLHNADPGMSWLQMGADDYSLFVY